MAKKELNFGKLGLPPKATIIKKDEEKDPLIEQAIEKIHGTKETKAEEISPQPIVEKTIVSSPMPKTKPLEQAQKAKAKAVVTNPTPTIELEEMMPVKKVSMDLPLDVYKYLKMNAFGEAITMKDYVLRLIEADMKKKQ